MMSLRKPRSCESLSMHGGHGGEKALSEICPRLLAGISLNTRRYIAVTYNNKSSSHDYTAENSRSFKSRGSLKRQSEKSDVPIKGSAINESANISLCNKVYFYNCNYEKILS